MDVTMDTHCTEKCGICSIPAWGYAQLEPFKKTLHPVEESLKEKREKLSQLLSSCVDHLRKERENQSTTSLRDERERNHHFKKAFPSFVWIKRYQKHVILQRNLQIMRFLLMKDENTGDCEEENKRLLNVETFKESMKNEAETLNFRKLPLPLYTFLSAPEFYSKKLSAFHLLQELRAKINAVKQERQRKCAYLLSLFPFELVKRGQESVWTLAGIEDLQGVTKSKGCDPRDIEVTLQYLVQIFNGLSNYLDVILPYAMFFGSSGQSLFSCGQSPFSSQKSERLSSFGRTPGWRDAELEKVISQRSIFSNSNGTEEEYASSTHHQQRIRKKRDIGPSLTSYSPRQNEQLNRALSVSFDTHTSNEDEGVNTIEDPVELASGYETENFRGVPDSVYSINSEDQAYIHGERVSYFNVDGKTYSIIWKSSTSPVDNDNILSEKSVSSLESNNKSTFQSRLTGILSATTAWNIPKTLLSSTEYSRQQLQNLSTAALQMGGSVLYNISSSTLKRLSSIDFGTRTLMRSFRESSRDAKLSFSLFHESKANIAAKLSPSCIAHSKLDSNEALRMANENSPQLQPLLSASPYEPCLNSPATYSTEQSSAQNFSFPLSSRCNRQPLNESNRVEFISTEAEVQGAMRGKPHEEFSSLPNLMTYLQLIGVCAEDIRVISDTSKIQPELSEKLVEYDESLQHRQVEKGLKINKKYHQRTEEAAIKSCNWDDSCNSLESDFLGQQPQSATRYLQEEDWPYSRDVFVSRTQLLGKESAPVSFPRGSNLQKSTPSHLKMASSLNDPYSISTIATAPYKAGIDSSFDGMNLKTPSGYDELLEHTPSLPSPSRLGFDSPSSREGTKLRCISRKPIGPRDHVCLAAYVLDPTVRVLFEVSFMNDETATYYRYCLQMLELNAQILRRRQGYRNESSQKTGTLLFLLEPFLDLQQFPCTTECGGARLRQKLRSDSKVNAKGSISTMRLPHYTQEKTGNHLGDSDWVYINA